MSNPATEPAGAEVAVTKKPFRDFSRAEKVQIGVEFKALKERVPDARKRIEEKYGFTRRQVAYCSEMVDLGPGKPKAFTAEERAAWAQKYQAARQSGVPGAGAAVAKEAGVLQQSLAGWAPTRPPGYRVRRGGGERTAEDMKAPMEAYRQGMPYTDIRVNYGVTRETIVKWAKQLGLPPRKGGRPAQGKARAAAVESMNTALQQMNGKLPLPVSTSRPGLENGDGLIGGAVSEFARRLKLRGARLVRLEADGGGYTVTYEVTQRFSIE